MDFSVIYFNVSSRHLTLKEISFLEHLKDGDGRTTSTTTPTHSKKSSDIQ